jgi:hypothetical protein
MTDPLPLYTEAQQRLHAAISHCFVETLADFLAWMLGKFPACTETAAAQMKVHGVVLKNPQSEERAIQSFSKSLLRDVTAQCSYGKAVQCLTGQPVTLHTVAHYKDADIMLHPSNLPSLLAKVKPQDKYGACDADDKRKTWEYIHALVRLTQLRVNYRVFRLPTSAEITANIKQRTQTQQGDASVTAGAVRLLIDHCAEASVQPEKESLAESLRTQLGDQAFCSAFVQQWLLAMDTTIEGTQETYGAAVARQDVAACVRLPHSLLSDFAVDSSYQKDTSNPVFAKLPKLMDHVNSIFAVQSALPDTMMRSIEAKAGELRHKMESGEALDPAALTTIGMDVMRQCSGDDLQQCMNSMSTLMPQISKLAQSMQ